MSRVNIDPTGSFKDCDPNKLVEACGLLPIWAIQADFYEGGFKEALTTLYAFYTGVDMEGGIIKTDGTYCYPGDPDLKPLLSMQIPRVSGICYFYQYGIVAVVTDSETWVTRMD
jgi:hypothetical protein